MAKLILSMDGLVLKEIPLTKERMSIGRKPNNDIQIDNLAISGEHAAVVWLVVRGQAQVAAQEGRFGMARIRLQRRIEGLHGGRRIHDLQRLTAPRDSIIGRRGMSRRDKQQQKQKCFHDRNANHLRHGRQAVLAN